MCISKSHGMQCYHRHEEHKYFPQYIILRIYYLKFSQNSHVYLLFDMGRLLSVLNIYPA